MSSQLNKIFIPHNWSLPSNASTSSWPEFLFLTSFPLPVSLSVTLFALSVCLSVNLFALSVCLSLSLRYLPACHSLCAICLYVTLFALSACMSLTLRCLTVWHSLCAACQSVCHSLCEQCMSVCHSLCAVRLSVCHSCRPLLVSADSFWKTPTSVISFHPSVLVWFFSTLRLFPWLSATGQVTCKVFFYWQWMYIFPHRWAKLTERVSSI